MQRRDQHRMTEATTITRTQHSSTSRTVTSTQSIKSSGSSRRSNETKSSAATQPPPSLNLWGRRSEDRNSLMSGSLSSLGLQQMSGYDDLEVMQREAPMEWADDDDKSRGKTTSDPVSSIAFPVSTTPPTEEADLQRGLAGRGDGARFNSLPARQPGMREKAQQRVPRHSTLTGRPVLAEQRRNTQGSHILSADSSGYSTPEGGKSMTTRSGQLSLRQRSIKSLQGIASAWVPAAVRSPYDSENDTESSSAVALQKEKAVVKEKRPIKLDRRRLNKAVSLAVEAAQASEQDQRAWKLKKKRLARQQQQAAMKKIEESKQNDSRFASLPWRRSPRTAPKSLGDSDGDAKQGALVTYKSRGSLSGDEDDEEGLDDDDDDDSSQNTKRAGFPVDDLSTDSSEDSEADAVPDDFSVDLYVSSLSYLLTALSPKDVENVGEKHREEMKRKLEEALRNLEGNQDASGAVTSTDREEVIRLRVERELAMMEQAYYQRQGVTSSSSRAQQAARASSEERIRKQSVAGYLASSAIDLGLSVGAGALAAASRGVASLVPMLTADDNNNNSKGRGDMETLRPTSIEEISDSEDSPLSSSKALAKPGSGKAGAKVDEKSPPILTHSQWELTRTLAHSVASTMYNNLAAVAEQRRQDGPPGGQVAVYNPGGSTALVPADKDADASDQLLIMAATLARNVKRSPLPSQVRALTSQVVSLIGALDERYSISKRSADVALRKTGQALYYVRKNDLHVKALRAVWAIIEASVAAVEAYRDEEEWKGDLALQHREAKAIEARRPASR